MSFEKISKLLKGDTPGRGMAPLDQWGEGEKMATIRRRIIERKSWD